MVSFVCDNCQDTIKKPKLDQHFARCRAAFSCVDCYQTFTNGSWGGHTACVSEAQKVQGKHYRGPKRGNQAAKATSAAPATASEASPSSSAAPEPVVSESSEKTKKRSRDETKVENSEETTAKRPKLVESDATVASSASTTDLTKHLKLKKVAKKALKKAENKTMSAEDLSQYMLKEIQSSLQTYVSSLVDETIRKFPREGDKVMLKSRKSK